jgi:hypothetical protein
MRALGRSAVATEGDVVDESRSNEQTISPISARSRRPMTVTPSASNEELVRGARIGLRVRITDPRGEEFEEAAGGVRTRGGN